MTQLPRQVDDLEAQARTPDLLPSEPIRTRLAQGWGAQQAGNAAQAAQIYAHTVALAQQAGDRPGEARSLAQLAALEESCGEIESARAHNARTIELFLALGDGAGLVQSYRLQAFLHLRQGNIDGAAASFAQAFGLALQLDTALVLTTLNQFLPVVRHLVDSSQVSALLPLGAAVQQAVSSVESQRGAWPESMSDVAEIVHTVGAIWPPLAIMAEEVGLSAEQRRSLAARATHQAWLVDALTRRRWNLSDLVEMTLVTKLNFHEKLD